jgi:putative endonuclease
LDKQYYVYILASRKNGTLYIGATSNLEKRVWQHKNKIVKGFTEKYDVNRLVYFEIYESPSDAVVRERQMKKWNRKWKIALIEKKNPEWVDLCKRIE